MGEVEPEGNGEEAEEVVVPANLEPVVFGPPAYGSQDPATSGLTLLPREDLPEMIEVTDTAPVGEGVEEGPAPPEGDEYTEEELNAMTKDELLTVAQGMGLTEITMANTKAEMVAAILDAQAAA